MAVYFGILVFNHQISSECNKTGNLLLHVFYIFASQMILLNAKQPNNNKYLLCQNTKYKHNIDVCQFKAIKLIVYNRGTRRSTDCIIFLLIYRTYKLSLNLKSLYIDILGFVQLRAINLCSRELRCVLGYTCSSVVSPDRNSVEETNFRMKSPSSSAHAASATRSGSTMEAEIGMRLCWKGRMSHTNYKIKYNNIQDSSVRAFNGKVQHTASQKEWKRTWSWGLASPSLNK